MVLALTPRVFAAWVWLPPTARNVSARRVAFTSASGVPTWTDSRSTKTAGIDRSLVRLAIWSILLSVQNHQFPETQGPARSLGMRSEEHTSELQSHSDLVCRLLLEKKKQ